ncbi:MAG: hypothetical protein JSV65_17290 [Armatimonadota bacterium]|nr:MAG: hypothetical protein JSV65_17290 [Armatimonadota bacterium]
MTPRERDYQALIGILSSWCSGSSLNPECDGEEHSGTELLDLLGDPTPLKIWQVQRVIEKIGMFLDPHKRWREAYDNVVDTEHTGRSAEFRDRTKQTVVQDTEDGQPAETTLAVAIDMLTGCNWNFLQNTRTILAAIGGEVHAQNPLTLHARNIKLNPARERMRHICRTIGAFTEGQQTRADIDLDVLRMLGAATTIKCWLAASLEKTIRLQIDL